MLNRVPNTNLFSKTHAQNYNIKFVNNGSHNDPDFWQKIVTIGYSTIRLNNYQVEDICLSYMSTRNALKNNETSKSNNFQKFWSNFMP